MDDFVVSTTSTLEEARVLEQVSRRAQDKLLARVKGDPKGKSCRGVDYAGCARVESITEEEKALKSFRKATGVDGMTEDSVTIDLSGLGDIAKSLIRTMAHLATMKGEPSHISQPSLIIMWCITQIELARKEGKSSYRRDVSGKLYSPYREIMVAAFKLYQESTDWQANREKVFEKSKGLCVECGEPVKFAHHTSYENWALGDYELSDLEGRCGRCHSRAHKRGKDIAVPFFARRDPETGYIPQDEMDALANRVML